MNGRRIPWTADGGTDPIALLTEAGDYCGPVMGYTGDKPAVFYLLPVARDAGIDPGFRSIGHVTAPPHSFRECEDGSLEIRESILHQGSGGSWHGYLDEGNVWREC